MKIDKKLDIRQQCGKDGEIMRGNDKKDKLHNATQKM